MAHRSRAAGIQAPAVHTNTGAVFAYSKAQLAKADRELDVMRKDAQSGRRVNKELGDLQVTHRMHRKHYFNALAAGENPTEDSMYRRDMIKRGCIVEVPVHSDSITARPLSEQGRQEFDRIFGKN